MPTKPRREDTFIELFLSAYENFSWADADKDWVDRRLDKAVEMLATRKTDGRTLAIEHTLIEACVLEKEDEAFFKRSFLKIQDDEALVVPERWIRVFIPVGTLHGHHKPASRDVIVSAVHDWIRTNRLNIPDGETHHQCKVTGVSGGATFEIPLTTKATPSRHGALHVGRQGRDDFSDVIAKALRCKLPKLVAQEANSHILILERQQFTLVPEQILGEIERQRTGFSELSKVDEIWILETIGYEQSGCFGFELYRDDELVGTYSFERGGIDGPI